MPESIPTDCIRLPRPSALFSTDYFIARSDGSQIAQSQPHRGETDNIVVSELFVADGNGRNPRVAHAITSSTAKPALIRFLQPVALQQDDDYCRSGHSQFADARSKCDAGWHLYSAGG